MTADALSALEIADDAPLRACTERFKCTQCTRMAMYYCCHCLRLAPALEGALPAVRLPFARLVVVKDVREHDSKSTALHAKILAPDQVEVVAYSRGAGDVVPPVLAALDPERTAVLFPGPGAVPVSRTSFGLACGCTAPAAATCAPSLPPVTTVVVIDGTWRQAKTLARSPALARFTRMLALDERPGGETLFWRYQSVGPHCLATIEAIHRLCVDAHAGCACGGLGPRPDNLLFFFAFFYRRIQQTYVSGERTFTPRRGEGYIRKVD